MNPDRASQAGKCIRYPPPVKLEHLVTWSRNTLVLLNPSSSYCGGGVGGGGGRAGSSGSGGEGGGGGKAYHGRDSTLALIYKTAMSYWECHLLLYSLIQLFHCSVANSISFLTEDLFLSFLMLKMRHWIF